MADRALAHLAEQGTILRYTLARGHPSLLLRMVDFRFTIPSLGSVDETSIRARVERLARDDPELAEGGAEDCEVVQ
jgi:hypothetical protein